MTALNATFDALSDPTRRAIVDRLRFGPTSVGELAQPFDISLPAISRHLGVLERAGLIRREVDAQRRICRLETAALREAFDWIEQYRRFWDDRFDELERYLDETKHEEEQST